MDKVVEPVPKMLHDGLELFLGHPQFEELLRLDQLDILLEASVSHLTVELPLLQLVLIVLQLFCLDLFALVLDHLRILRVDQMDDLAALTHVISVVRSQADVPLNVRLVSPPRVTSSSSAISKQLMSSLGGL